MINLLSDESKRQIRAARTNVILVRYIIIIVFAFAFLVLIIGGAYFVITGTKTNAEAVIAANQSKASAYGSVEAQAASLQASLSSAKTILDQEILYTKIITDIAGLTPNGVVLDRLTLSPTTFGTPTTIQAYATTTDAGIALKDKFQSSALFSNVTIQSISNKSGITGYPVNVTLSVTINKAGAQ